jgi:hypothetical protein
VTEGEWVACAVMWLDASPHKSSRTAATPPQEAGAVCSVAGVLRITVRGALYKRR